MNDEIFVKLQEDDALKGLKLSDYVDRISEILKGSAKEVYLFGSRARGENRVESDVDIIIVVDTDLPFHERFKLFPELFEITGELDLLIYTPSEFEKIKNEDHVGFWKHVFKTYKRIL